MPNLTLSIPRELHSFVKEHREVNWSEIVRRSIEEYSKRIMAFEKAVKKKMKEEIDVEKLLKKATEKIGS